MNEIAMSQAKSRPTSFRRALSALVSGALFAVGLALGGMTQPAKVVGFLDIFGEWDPSLVFVMAGAVATYTLLYRLILKRPTPLFAAGFSFPKRKDIDVPLVGGAFLFGVGWGLSGLCPGPALCSLATGRSEAFLFVGSMLLGIGLTKGIQGFLAGRAELSPTKPHIDG
jgi:uncharacterized membrane protein YedE/YeeE